MLSFLLPILAPLGLGLILGLRHAFEPDHVTAVATVVTGTRSVKRAALYGGLWGLGHTATLLIAGLVVVVFKVAIPEPLARSFELLVGLVLIGLGINLFRRLAQCGLRHILSCEHAADHGAFHHPAHQHRRSFIIGIIHGLDGSAALTLLALSSVASPALAMAFIVVFGLGSIVGMLLATSVMAAPLILASRTLRIQRLFQLLAAGASLSFGLFMIWQITGAILY